LWLTVCTYIGLDSHINSDGYDAALRQTQSKVCFFKMSVSASYIGLNNVKKILFTCVLLVVIIYSLTLLEFKENVLFNTLKNLQISKDSWKRDPDSFDFDTLTGAQLMEYLKWPNETACERVGYYGGVLEPMFKLPYNIVITIYDCKL